MTTIDAAFVERIDNLIACEKAIASIGGDPATVAELVTALRLAVDALDASTTNAPMKEVYARLAQTWMRAKYGDAARAALAKLPKECAE